MSGRGPLGSVADAWSRSGPAARLLGAVVAGGAAWALAAAALPSGLPPGIALYGVVLGLLDGLTAMGLVLVYRSAKVVNFAQADIGGLAAAVAVVMVTGAHLPYLAAVPLGLAAGLLTGALLDAVVVRRFQRAPRLILTVATIGVAQVLGAGELGLPTLFGHLSPLSTFRTPFGGQFTVGPVVFDGNDVAVFAVVPVILAGLWWFLGRTGTGIAMRGAADAEDRAQLLGIPVRRLSRTTWTAAAGLSAVAAILTAPVLGPDLGAVAGPPALLVPLAAAVLAGMESLPWALVAAVGIDVGQQAVLWSYPRSSTVDVAVFGIVLVGVLLRRRSLSRRSGDASLGTLQTSRDRPMPAALAWWRPLRIARAGLLLAGLAAAVAVPTALSPARQTILTAIVIYAVVAVSMVVLLGWAGQLSLGQFAFVGIGAAVTGALLVHVGADLFLALLAAAAVGAVAALALGVPSLRVPGLFLGVVTMAFAVPVSTWLLDSSYFPSLTPAEVPRPDLLGRISLGSPTALYELCLVVLVLVLVLARNFRHSRIGRVLIAARDNDRAAASLGVAPARVRLVAFTLSGALAGLAGGLQTLDLRGVPFSGFNPEESIVVFTMVVVGGIGSLPGALLGAAYVEVAQYFLTGAAQLLATGAGLLVLLMVLPGGLGEAVARLRDRLLRAVARRAGIEVATLERRPRVALPAMPPAGDAAPSNGLRPAGAVPAGTGPAGTGPAGTGPAGLVRDVLGHGAAAPALVCRSLDAAYGDLQVLFEADLAVRSGEITALLGVNGSGKSTLLKVVAGVLPAKGGRVELSGVDVTGWDPVRRVRAGLALVPGGRGVFPGLTVAENLRLGGWVLRHDRQRVAARTEVVLDLFPALRRRLHLAAGELSGGEQQMLALGQALLAEPSVLLVDELSLGLAPTVVAQLLEVLRGLARRGVAVVVVEQSINVATALAPTASFLERGQVRYRGPTADLAERPDLARAVFLGSVPGGPAAIASPVVPSPVVASPVVAPPGTARWCDGDEPVATSGLGPGPSGAALDLRGVSVRFGGVQAVAHVTLRVAPGEVVGLIGANGAGKTTLLDVASGFVGCSGGRVLVDEMDVTAMAPAARARMGLGRMFQDARLFPSLTVAETVTAAFDRHLEVRDPLALTLRLGDARRSESEAAAAAAELIERFNLGPCADAFVGELSTGTRRMVELAVVLAQRPTMLLADEPSSGIAQREVEALGQLLLALRAETGAGVLLVEHDMALLRQVADRLVCLHLGGVLAEGTPDEVLAADAVVAAYLGTDEVAVARSG